MYLPHWINELRYLNVNNQGNISSQKLTKPVLYQDHPPIWKSISCRLLPNSLSVGLPSGVVGIIILSHYDTLLEINLFIFMHKYGQRQIGTTILVLNPLSLLALYWFPKLIFIRSTGPNISKDLLLKSEVFLLIIFLFAIKGWLKLHVNEI